MAKESESLECHRHGCGRPEFEHDPDGPGLTKRDLHGWLITTNAVMCRT